MSSTTRRLVLLAGAASAAIGLPGRASIRREPSVVFIDPGSAMADAAGPMSRMATDFMAIAARQLGMPLEIQHAQHDHLQMIRLAEGLAARPRPPDYAIIVNDKLAAPAMLAALAGAATRVFVIHSDVTDEQRRSIGNERERFAHWIGSAVPDGTRGTFRLAAALHRSLGDAPIRAVAITGPHSTPVSNERALGLSSYVAGVPGSRLEQLVYGDWTGPDAQRKASILLARYPQANLIWAANDEMALGALKAATERGMRPRVGGMGGWSEALRSIGDGGMTATLVGHHLIGAFALVLLFDHAHGVDFATTGGVHRRLDYLHVVTLANLAEYEAAFSERDRPIDFTRFSRVRHPNAAGDFDLTPLLSRP